VRSVKVSAMLGPVPSSSKDADPDSGSRFTALRQFAIETCNDVGNTGKCSSVLPSDAPGSPYTRIYTSPDNAFAGTAPRPLAPQLLFKMFDVPDTTATHVRLVALENQCTGNAAYAGEQDSDPTNDTDCKSASDRDEFVHAAELEVYSFDSTTRPAGDPVVAEVMTGPATAAPGDQVTYTLTYHNLGPAASSAARITISQLPAGLSFVKASGDVVYDPTTRQVVWRLGDVAAGATGKVTLTTNVAGTAHPGDVLLTTAQFSGASTFAPPAAAVTVVSPLTP
jgi:extracellular elastinolytic metalloproteinase